MSLAFLIAWLITGSTVTTWWMIERGIPYRHYYGARLIVEALVSLTITGPIYMIWSSWPRPTAATEEGEVR